MSNLKEDLKEKIHEIERNTKDLGEVYSGEEPPTTTDMSLMISTYSNMVKAKILLEVYNQHVYDEDLIESEKELDNALKEIESDLIDRLKESYRV